MMGLRDSSLFELSAGNSVLDFVNTLDNRFREDGPVELLQDYDDLLRFAQQTRLLSAHQSRLLASTVKKGAAERAVKSARELREAAAAVLYSGVDGGTPVLAAMQILERHYLNVRRHQVLQWKQSKLVWRWAHFEDTRTEAELPVCMLALESSVLMTSEAMGRVRSCGSETCRWLFLDTSKNHTRRWCNMKICGNRMKARRFQARQGQ